MSHPWVHAVSSAKTHGGQPEDYLTLHTLMDLTKSAHAQVTHRAVFHSWEGVEILEALVGLEVSGVRTTTLATQHVEEDLGLFPSLADYLAGYASPFRFLGGKTAGDHADATHKKYGGVWSDHYLVHYLVDCYSPNADPKYGLLLHHALGPWLAEKKFGPVIVSNGVTLYTRYLVEQHILADLGRIPSLSDWLAPMKPLPWMAGAGKMKNLYAH